jgi:hypothetical protein
MMPNRSDRHFPKLELRRGPRGHTNDEVKVRGFYQGLNCSLGLLTFRRSGCTLKFTCPANNDIKTAEQSAWEGFR